MSKLTRSFVLGVCAGLFIPGTGLAQSGGAHPPAPAAQAPGTSPSVIGAPGTAAATGPAARGAQTLAMSDEILKEVSKLRGLPVRRPVPSGLKSRADIESVVLKDMAESSTPQKFADTTRMLRFL